MTLTADLFFSIRSPYSYLAIGRYRRLAETHDIDITLRMVHPIAIRDPEFFKRSDPNWLRYVVRDVVRLAEFHGLPLGLPDPDPIVQDMQTGAIAEDQPYIRPLAYLGVEASRRGRGVAFAHEAASIIWGGVKDWDKEGRLAAAADRAGLDLADMQAAILGHEAEYEAELQTNLDALTEAGHWGVPTLVFNAEPFFGHDRVDVAIWRMKQNGLAPR